MNFFAFMKEQIETIKKIDPSVQSTIEVFFFPGFKALNTWYFTHKLYQKGHKTFARYLSLRAQRKTGVDIHPGAQIGHNCFIDHGMGVVIGETCIIGNNVTLYQQVTLGATGNVKGKRHPTLEDNVVVGAGSKIIGAITLHEGCKIGAGSIVVKDVPAYYTVVPTPAHAVKDGTHKIPVLTVDGLQKQMNEELERIRLDERYILARMQNIESEQVELPVNQKHVHDKTHPYC